MRRVILICLGILLGCQPAMAMTSQIFSRVMDAVDSRDLRTLKELKSSGVDMNSPLPNGMTPLCETVAQGDYEGYEMLLTQGASPYVACIRQLPEHQVADFYANQPPAQTYYTGRLDSARAASEWGKPALKEFSFPTLGVGEVLLGGVAVAGILTLGHGGKAPGEDSKNKYVWPAPLDLKPAEFESRQYTAENVFSGDPEVDNSINFLGSIHASSAYARGYTGYKVKRNADGSLDGEGSAAIDKEKRVQVAIVDDGVWVNHPQLKTNTAITSNKTYNFVYGACDDTFSGKCWKPISEVLGSVTVQLYDNGEPVSGRLQVLSKLDWLVYQTLAQDYGANDPTPTSYKAWSEASTPNVLYSRYRIGEQWYLYDPNNLNPNPTDGLGGWAVTCDDDGKNCYYTVGEEDRYVDVVIEKYDNHGTHVAGLVASKSNGDSGTSGMMGVAYNANIIPIKFDETMDETLNHISNAVNLGADIVNFSSASPSAQREDIETLVQQFDDVMAQRPDFLHAYQTAAKNSVILVFAAGNYTGDAAPYESSIFSMAPLSSSLNGTTKAEDGNTYNLNNLFVNVVALDDSFKKLAGYSARCGATKSYCVAAPGGSQWNMYSTIYDDGGYTYGGDMGTSMAAPIVSGALAVIKGAFPHLTNQQVVQILFATADYISLTKDQKNQGETEEKDALGKYNSVYGRGLVNLDAATSPIGLPKIPLSSLASGVSFIAGTSSATVPSSFSGVAHALPAHMIVLDKYDRAFAVPTSAFIHVAKRENKLDGRFKSFMRGDEKIVATTDKMTMAYSERRSNLNGKGMQHGSMRFEVRPTPKWSFKSYYTENTETTGGSYFERLMQSHYAKMKEAWGGAVSYDLGKNWKATVSGQIGQNGFVDEDDLNDMNHNKISLLQSSLQYNGLKKVGLKLTGGITNEQGSTLGMWGRGAFKSGNSKTSFVGAGMTLNLTDALTLEGMYYIGKTEVNNGRSLVKMSDLTSDSFALTAAWKVNDGRTLGLQFVSPLRVRRGVATVDLPVARDAYQDVVYRESVKANLKPTAREYDIGFYYAENLQEDVHFQSEMGVRLNPDHVAGAAPDWRALVGLHFGL